jgi:hypothetical protein
VVCCVLLGSAFVCPRFVDPSNCTGVRLRVFVLFAVTHEWLSPPWLTLPRWRAVATLQLINLSDVEFRNYAPGESLTTAVTQVTRRTLHMLWLRVEMMGLVRTTEIYLRF